MKTCTKCKIEKPVTEFSKHSTAKDGLRPSCKGCCSRADADRYANNRDAIRENHARHYKENKDSYRERNSKNYWLNRSARLSHSSKYEEANRGKIRLRKTAYDQANREKNKARISRHYAENKEKYFEKSRDRRALKKNAEGSHTSKDVLAILEGQGGLCAACNTKLLRSGRSKYHVDHIMPLAKGGSNWPSNLQCLCPTCNLRKGAKDPIEWAAQLGRLF